MIDIQQKNKSYILRNIVYKAVDGGPVSAIYVPSQSIFDLIMDDMPNLILHDITTNNSHYYDILINNHCLNHTQNTQALARHLHIQDILWFHSLPPKDLKREDLILIYNQLKRLTVKIFPSIEIAKSWGFDNSNATILPYGIPDNPYDITKKNKKVVILNLTNNTNINNLYTHIKKDIPEIDIINDIHQLKSINNLYEILSQYHICIDIYDTINTLIGSNCGCKCITSTTQPQELIGITQILDYTNISNIVQSLLSDPLSISDTIKNIQYIKQHYSIYNFQETIMKLFNSIKYKEFFKL